MLWLPGVTCVIHNPSTLSFPGRLRCADAQPGHSDVKRTAMPRDLRSRYKVCLELFLVPSQRPLCSYFETILRLPSDTFTTPPPIKPNWHGFWESVRAQFGTNREMELDYWNAQAVSTVHNISFGRWIFSFCRRCNQAQRVHAVNTRAQQCSEFASNTSAVDTEKTNVPRVRFCSAFALQ